MLTAQCSGNVDQVCASLLALLDEFDEKMAEVAQAKALLAWAHGKRFNASVTGGTVPMRFKGSNTTTGAALLASLRAFAAPREDETVRDVIEFRGGLRDAG